MTLKQYNAMGKAKVKSGATPRRRKTQAVRPRAADRRKGMLTKRGNAHQERQKLKIIYD